MALGTDHIINADVGEFIPELWSDDVIAAYKSNLVMANHVTRIDHTKRKGDTIHIPSPARGSANAKVAETQVVLNNPAVNNVDVLLDKHYEYSHLIEDITEIQALDSMRRFYTDDAGYQLAKTVDTFLTNLGGGFQASTAYSTATIGSDASTVWDPSANTNTGNAAALADPGVRRAMRVLDDLDAPMTGRTWVVPPVTKENLLGIDRFVLWTSVGEAASANSIRNGGIGDLYGAPVFVSTNIATVLADDATTEARAVLYFHKGALAYAEVMGVRSQSQYKLEHLSWLYTADTIFGVAELRDTSGVALLVPN